MGLPHCAKVKVLNMAFAKLLTKEYATHQVQ